MEKERQLGDTHGNINNWRYDMENILNKKWFYASGIRALRTVAQTAVATIGTSAAMADVNWIMVLSASALAGILSLLTSIAGLPEIEKEESV